MKHRERETALCYVNQVGFSLGDFEQSRCALSVPLADRERDLLAALLAFDPSLHVPDNILIELVWPDPDLEPEFVNMCLKLAIHRLRKKGIPIENRFNYGYRIISRWHRTPLDKLGLLV